MPLRKGKRNVSFNIRELHKGPQYQRTLHKFGKAKANRQAVAVALSVARKKGRKKRRVSLKR